MASVPLDRLRRIREFPCRIAIAILLAHVLQLSLQLFAQDRLLPVFSFRKVKDLSTDQIRSHVVRDRDGFFWVGTLYGLNRYDGSGVRLYRNDPKDPSSISSNDVRAVFVDRMGRLWVGMFNSGLSLYDPARDRFINFIPRQGDTSWYASNRINDLFEDRSGNIWMATFYGGIVCAKIPPGNIENLDSLAAGIHFTTYPLGTPGNHAYCMTECQDGTILVGSDKGMKVLDPVTRTISRLHVSDTTGLRLDSVSVSCIRQNERGELWIGTRTEGLFQIGRDLTTVRNFRHRVGDELSLPAGLICDIVEEQHGNLWIAGAGGVAHFSTSTGKCIPYLTTGSLPKGPFFELKMSLDPDGVLWIGTMDRGLHWLSPRSQRFPLYSLPDKDSTSPMAFFTVERDKNGSYWFQSGGGVIYQINMATNRVTKRIDVLRGKKPSYALYMSFVDKRGVYWFCTQGLGLFRVDLSSGEVRNYAVGPGQGMSPFVNCIAQGEGDTLWIAGGNRGLLKFSTSSGRCSRVLGLPPDEVFWVMKDREGKIWISSSLNGITIFDPRTGATERLVHNPSDVRSLSDNNTRGTYLDSLGRIWVGAGNEINLWDGRTHSFTRYSNPEFTLNPFADIMGFDTKGRVWVSNWWGERTGVLDPSDGAFATFSATEGIKSDALMANLPDGRIVLPAPLGINIFSPDSITMHAPPPPLVISRMSINDGPAVRPRLAGGTAPLRLQYFQNVLEFDFVAIDIDAPELVHYQYMLEGLEKDWVMPEGRRTVRYLGLAPGDYVFRVKAASSRSEWPDQEIALAISIAPPWWRATWAYTCYGFIVVGLLFAGYRLRLRQIHLKQAAEMEHFQAEHLAEVDRLKSRFFSNISHEFRTPLTLILGPADQGLETSDVQTKDQKFRLIKDSARRLVGLVNQLLDFSRLESGMMRLQVSSGDVVWFLRRIVMSFESWAERKKINLEFCSDIESATGFFDGDKLEKVLNNLISNALKFTGEGGTITTQLHVTHSPPRPLSERSVRESGREGEWVTITVSDTGAGIAPEHLSHIFDRFYRVDQTHTTEGTGIGLALTKELVELHHGTITVESSPGKGSVFTVALPIGREPYKTEEITATVAEPEEGRQIDIGPRIEESKAAPAVSDAGGKPIVLVVEDNADLRVYLREYLERDYAVQEADNGKVGYDRSVETTPDLVISDVMMPEMDGMELCRALKQDIRTSHVPVILLTARAGTDSKIEGLEIGADDYVTKPFDAKELLARVRNLIQQRKRLREKFSAGVVLKPGEVAVSSLDDALLKKVMEAVELNIADVNFGVDDLAREVCLSRAHLNHKLQALTNLTPVEFIRYVRLQRAYQLLEKNAAPIAEIAFQVGFGSPSYFGACFRERFGFPPSDILHKHS